MQNNTLREVSEQDVKKRLRLRVAAKMMMYLAFAGVIYVILSAMFSGDGEAPDVPSMRVDITNLQPGETDFLTWEGRPVLVYRRTDEEIVALRSENPLIKDSLSTRSEQPEFAQNALRSENFDYFVAIALGMGRGCTVEHLPASDEAFQGQPWPGGFVESCGTDRYDLAGRVFNGQYAGENLQVPSYSVEGGTLVLGR